MSYTALRLEHGAEFKEGAIMAKNGFPRSSNPYTGGMILSSVVKADAWNRGYNGYVEALVLIEVQNGI